MQSITLVSGSVASIAKDGGRSLAESFLSVDVLVIVDVSGSMAAKDAPGGKSRYEVACAELALLQNNHPGKIGIVAFSNVAEFVPAGIPPMMGRSTNMIAALQFIKCADGLGIQFIMLSDGAPDEPQETLQLAGTFKTHIDCVYIGPENKASGRLFLEKLAQTTGGKFAKTRAPALLGEPVRLLI